MQKDISCDVYKRLSENHKHNCIKHSKNVAEYALSMMDYTNDEKTKIKIMCALHDISVLYDKDSWIDRAKAYNIDIIKEEEQFPVLIHQKLSAAIAQDEFKIDDRQILSAISCHTTLKENPSKLDLILYIADKMTWDQIDTPKYFNSMEIALKSSLYHGAYSHINYMINSPETLIIHPQLLRSYQFLSTKIYPNLI